MTAIPKGFGTVTFSVMATVGHQDPTRGIAAHPLAAPWEVRRALCRDYFKQGQFDFIGLKHCHYHPSQPTCAHSYFHRELDQPDTPYGALQAVVRPTPAHAEKGDTMSILYRRDIWQLDETASAGAVWHKTAAPQGEPGGHGNVFHHAAFERQTPADGVRPARLHVYNIRMRDKDSPALDIYRALCLGEILAHIRAHVPDGVPVVLLADTNCKAVGSRTDRLLLGKDSALPGLKLRPAFRLRDSYLDLHPDAHGKVRTQHNFKKPGDIGGDERNSRILYLDGLETTDAVISSWAGPDGAMPSYHYPVEGWFRMADGGGAVAG